MSLFNPKKVNAANITTIGVSVILAGLLATPFVGNVAMGLAFLVAGSAMTYWILICGVRGIREPLKNHSWAIAAITAIEYIFYLCIAAAFLVGVFRSM